MNDLKENIELDARLVLAGMIAGMEGVMIFASTKTHIFKTTEAVTERCEWLKKQREEYIVKVSERAAELESNANW